MESTLTALDQLKASLGPLPEPMVNPPIVVVSGLPGTGKSYFCLQLLKKLPAAWVQSDALRKTLFPSPTYSAEESARLFTLLHQLLEEFLSKGIPVVFDATNLSERNREHLYHIANKVGARLILVRVEAPAELVRERLQARQQGANGQGYSEAGWEVYQRMKGDVEPIGRPHFAADTSRDIGPVIEKILREANR